LLEANTFLLHSCVLVVAFYHTKRTLLQRVTCGTTMLLLLSSKWQPSLRSIEPRVMRCIRPSLSRFTKISMLRFEHSFCEFVFFSSLMVKRITVGLSSFTRHGLCFAPFHHHLILNKCPSKPLKMDDVV